MELTELLFEGSDLFEILFINSIKAHLFFSLPEETLKRIIKCKYNREERLIFLKAVLSDIVNSNCCIEATELEREINNFLKNTSNAERKRDLKQIKEVLRQFKIEATQETSEKKYEQHSPPMFAVANPGQALKAITKIGT